MTISKKITIGALILLAGVFFLPMKTWAADPSFTLTVDQAAGKISYSSTNCENGDVLKLTLNEWVSVYDTKDLYTESSGDLTDSEYDVLTLMGLTDSTTAGTHTKKLKGKIYRNNIEVTDSEKEVDIYAYIGNISTASGTTHLSLSSSSLITERTTNPDKTYYSTSGGYSITATAPYYIKMTSYENDINSKSTNINYKISEYPNVIVTEDKIQVGLPSKPTVNSTSFTSEELKISPEVSGYNLSSLYYDNSDHINLGTGTASADFTHSASYSKDTKKITWTSTGSAKYDNASFDIYFGEGSTPSKTEEYKVGTINYAINITAPITPTGVTISGGPSEVLKGETATYTATISPSGATGTIKWRVADGGSYASIDEATGKLTASAVGDVNIQAYVDGTAIESAKKTIKVIAISDVIVDGASSIVAKSGRTSQYLATVHYNTGSAAKSEDNGVTWAIVEGDSYATISDRGLLTLTPAADGAVGQKIKIRATSKKDGSVLSDSKEITLTDIVEVSNIDFVTKDVTKECVIDMSVGKNVKITPDTAIECIEYIEWSSSDAEKGEITGDYSYKNHNAGFKGKKSGATTLTPIIHYINGTKSTDSGMKSFSGTSFTVHNPVLVESFDSNDGLKFTLPDKVYMNYSADNNISEVTGYRIDVLNKDGNSVYNSTTSTSNKSISLSGDTVENLIENASSNLSGDSHQVRLKISPVGKSQTNSSNTVTNSESKVAATSGDRTAYKVSVSGTNIKSSSIYGLANHSVKITATPTSSTYKFAEWSDGNTSNPRTVTISTNTSSNSYTATANTTGTPKSSTAGNSSGSKGSNSKLDKVPKTGESMAIYFIVMIAVISGCVAFATLFKSLTAKAAKSEYEGSINSWRGGEDGTGESHKK